MKDNPTTRDAPLTQHSPLTTHHMNDHKSALVSAIESKDIARQPLSKYKEKVREHYDGPAGAFTAVTGILTGHEALAGRLIRPDGFDVRGCKHILDAGCGN